MEDCIFKNISSIKRNNIEAYLTVPSQDDEAVGKIAQLYILECFLNNKQIHNVLDRKEVKMIEDDETLNSFPWGRLVFNLTIEVFTRVSR